MIAVYLLTIILENPGKAPHQSPAVLLSFLLYPRAVGPLLPETENR
jgi:hypothetical protein